ncbi:MAG TPA: hypothetical protein VLC10_00365, partial [Patescibacteria group bacterium]|nr:hypothetical protein [Patescibacteria group bacterium]
TAASVFAHVMVVRVGDSWNHIVFASDEPFEPTEVAWRIPPGYEDIRDALLSGREVAYDPGDEVFTDDKAPVEFLTDSMVVAQVFGRKH